MSYNHQHGRQFMGQDASLKYFVAFLNYCLGPKKYGKITAIGKLVGKSRSTMSYILNGKYGTLPENERRILAKHFEYQYEQALELGQMIEEGRPLPQKYENRPVEQKFIKVPFIKEMKFPVKKGKISTFDLNDDQNNLIVLPKPSIGTIQPQNLKAFKMSDSSMEPVIALEGIVLVDLSDTALDRLKKPTIYLLCHDLKSGQCEIRYLSWATPELLAIESEQKVEFPTVYKTYNEVHIVGRVIWTSREF